MVITVSLSTLCWHMYTDIKGLHWSYLNDDTVEVSGQLVSIVERQWRYGQPLRRFEFRVTELHRHAVEYERTVVGRKLLVSLYGDVAGGDITLGQHYRMKVKIKPLQGLNNEHGFDYVRHMLAQGVVARATVVRDQAMLRLADSIDRYSLRAVVRSRLYDLTEGMSMQPVLMALAVGDRTLLSDDDRERLVNLGLAHLLAVSGLHIGLAAMLGYWLVFGLARLLCWPLSWIRLDLLMALSSAGAAFYYALLAGFTVSAVRALIMVSVVLICRVAWRRIQPMQGWLLALWLTMLYEPLQVYSAGLWLSFVAVLGLMYLGLGRRGGWWWPQLGLFFVMLVPSSLFFSKVSVISPLLNVLAVPFISLLIVPAVLLASLLAFVAPELALGLLSLINQGLAFAWQGLMWLDGWAMTTVALAAIPRFVYCAVVVAVLLLLMPRGLPGRWLAMVMVLPLPLLWLADPTRPVAQVTVLDVGQGLAVVVMSRNSVVVYDTGFGDGKAHAIGGRVVADFLQANGVTRIDRLVVSHGDNDHAGGLGELLRRFDVSAVVTPDEHLLAKHQVNFIRCQPGLNWTYDVVSFQVLSPMPEMAELNDNNRSCVLKVLIGKRSVLLPGDIERESELHLIAENNKALQADVLLVPHHGSKTSSTGGFLGAVQPQLAVVSAGRFNRFGHPHQKVLNRYRARAIEVVNTAYSGQLTLIVDRPGDDFRVERYLSSYRRYWQL